MFFSTTVINIVLNIFMQLDHRKNVKIENKECYIIIKFKLHLCFLEQKIRESGKELQAVRKFIEVGWKIK